MLVKAETQQKQKLVMKTGDNRISVVTAMDGDD